LTSRDARAVAEAVWRLEAPKLIAAGLRLVRDVSAAGDFAQDALVAALEQWPIDGIPSNPAAWLTAVVKRRAIDRLRRDGRYRQREPELTRRAMDNNTMNPNVDVDRIEDDLLRLVFIACHPAISQQARVALTLRLLGGLTTPEISRAFLVPEPTVAQRIVRAKNDLQRVGAALDEPDPAERAERLDAVLEVVYLIFNEGYAATSGDSWARPELCEEALRLGRLLRGLMPGENEVLGLVALMELQSSRLAARISADGSAVLLDDQDRSRWNRDRIRRGLAALAAAEALDEPMGPYLLQAQIAGCHARAQTAAETDWRRITFWFDLLAQVSPSPIVQLNRAVSVGRSHGPIAGLALLDTIRHDPKIGSNHLYHAVRGDLLGQLGRAGEARAAFLLAASLTANTAEQAVLQARAANQIDSEDLGPKYFGGHVESASLQATTLQDGKEPPTTT
jgi:RNA polymerase sigma factor (sigma-70 family)